MNLEKNRDYLSCHNSDLVHNQFSNTFRHTKTKSEVKVKSLPRFRKNYFSSSFWRNGNPAPNFFLIFSYTIHMYDQIDI